MEIAERAYKRATTSLEMPQNCPTLIWCSTREKSHGTSESSTGREASQDPPCAYWEMFDAYGVAQLVKITGPELPGRLAVLHYRSFLLLALMLGTVQVRPNSERLLVDGVPLTRGTDYSVDYDLGRVR